MSDCRGRDCGLDDCETCFGYPVAIIRPGDRVLLTVAFPIPASAGYRIKSIPEYLRLRQGAPPMQVFVRVI